MPRTTIASCVRRGSPRIVITGIGVVSPFGVGRERFWDHVSRGCSGTRAITEFDASDFACRVAAPVTGVTIDDVPALDGDDIWDDGLPRRSEALFARRADRRDRRARSVGRRRPAHRASRTPASSSAAAAAASTSASGSTTTSSSSAARRSRRTRFRCRSSAWCRARFRSRCGCAASATCCRAAARARPTRSATRRRCCAPARPTWCCRAAPTRASRPGMIFGFSRMRAVSTALQRSAGGGVAAVRPRARRLRARRRRVDGGARARGSRAGARRDDLRVDRRLRLDLRRLSPRADGAGRRGDRPRDDAGDRAVGPARAKRSATSTITARRRC